MGRAIQHRQIAPMGILWTKPETPHAWDIEFEDGNTLPSGWTENFTPSGTIDPYTTFSTGVPRREIDTWRKSCYAIQPPYDNAAKILSRAVTVPTNLFMWFRAAFSYRYNVSNPNDASFAFNISATDSGTVDLSNRITHYMNEADSNTISMQPLKTIGGSGTTVQTTANRTTLGAGQRYEFGAIQKIGTTYHFWAFTGNGQAFWIGSTTASIAVDRVSVFFNNNIGSAPGNSIMTVDFIRFKESIVFLPGYGS